MGNANGRQPPHAHHPNQAYTLSALVQGELAGPSGAVSGEWAARFYNAQGELLGTTPVWAAAEYQQPDTPALQTGTVSHASAAQMRLATTVTLDEGWLNFSDLTQQTASAPLPVVGGETYSLTVRLSGQLSTAEMGRLLLVTDGTPALVWSNTDVQQMDGIVISHAFTPPPNANTVHLVVETPLAGGWLALADVALAQFVPVQTITRSTYMLAGQATATRVSGHPDGNDGLHTLYSDHLGSASAMQKDDGSAPIITRYLPFGGYRASSGPNEVTDRGFTGHKHNDDLGLVYMNARFYVSGIGRFASADTIVPDPANPQQYNRYTYTLNNPLAYVDSTGHFSEGAIWEHIYSSVCYSDMACTYDTLTSWQQDAEWWEMLLAAEAGDVLFVSGGRHFRFLGEGRVRLNGIVYSEFNGEYNAIWQTTDEFYNLSLQDLFNGTNYNVWGGWYQVQGGSVVSIHYRPSTVTEWSLPGRKSFLESVGEAAAGGFASSYACAKLGVGSHSVLCGALASAIIGAYNAIPPIYSLDEGEMLIISAGHAHVYESRSGTLTVDGQMIPGSSAGYVRVYGPNIYRVLQRPYLVAR